MANRQTMNGPTWSDQRSITSRKNVEITVHGCSMRRGQMIVIYMDWVMELSLALLAETGNVTKTRLDRHHEYDSQFNYFVDGSR